MLTSSIFKYVLFGVIVNMCVAVGAAYLNAELTFDARWLAHLRRAHWDGRHQLPVASHEAMWIDIAYRGWGLDVVQLEEHGLPGPELHMAGWPMRSTWGYLHWTSAWGIGSVRMSTRHAVQLQRTVNLNDLDPATNMPRRFATTSCLIPLRPLWPGFVCNSLFYAVMVGLMAFATRTLRRCIRALRNQCGACGYPIGTSPVCTECGRKVPARVIAKLPA